MIKIETTSLVWRLGRMWRHPKEDLEQREHYTVPQYAQPQVPVQKDHMGGFRLAVQKDPDHKEEP